MDGAFKERSPIGATHYRHFEAQPVTGTFGARIDGVQLADALVHDELFTEIYNAWLKYQVLFFRDQDLSPEQQLLLGGRFGEIQKLGYVASLDDLDGVWVQEYPAMYDGPVADINWHADSSFRSKPTRGSLLYALDVPDGAGATRSGRTNVPRMMTCRRHGKRFSTA